MAAADLNIAMILKLVDQVTQPAKTVLGSLGRIGDASEQIGRAGVDWSNRQLEANRARQQALQGEALGVIALGGSLLALTEPAIQAERRLAEISKVVDFKGENGFQLLADDIRDLVTSDLVGATAEGITDIVAAAGRMGVVDENLPDAQKRAELLKFAADASKMAIAFGISADESGETLARWRQNLGLSHEQAMLLGDAVNLLGNTMATNEADILQVINRQGVVAKTAGLATDEIAALSATLLAAGAPPEIAATGLKNFTNALTRGESATKRQQEVWRALGLDATATSKLMQEDASEAILSVLEAFKDIEPYRRNSLIGDLFGEEAKGAITPLVENTQMLREALLKTADASQLVGLMEAEYQRQAATTHAQRQQFFEYLKGLSVVIGTVVLPQLNELMATVAPFVTMFTDWAQAHPELISLLFKVAGGLLVVKFGALAAAFAFTSMMGPLLHVIRTGSWLLTILPRMGRLLATLTVGPLSRLLRLTGFLSRHLLRFGRLLAWLSVAPIKWAIAGAGLLGKALLRLGAIARLNPIGVLITAIAGLAYVIYDNWDQIVSYVTEKIDRVRAAFDEGLLNGVLQVLAEFNPWRLMIEGAQGLIGYLMELVGVPEQIIARFNEFSLWDTGVSWMQSLWDGMLSLIDQLVGSIGEKLSALKPQWLSDLQGWVGGGNEESIPGRDSGGPVRAGVPYMVGERGRELFVPGVSGSILPTRVIQSALAASALAGSVASVAPNANDLSGMIDTRPPISTLSGGLRGARGGDTFNISIAPPPGADPAEIARMVREELERLKRERNADLHDGVDY